MTLCSVKFWRMDEREEGIKEGGDIRDNERISDIRK